MKIKQLTAGLAVAALTATLFVAQPLVSAQAVAPTSFAVLTPDPATQNIVNIDVTVEPGQVTELYPWNYISGWDTPSNTSWDYNGLPAIVNGAAGTISSDRWFVDCAGKQSQTGVITNGVTAGLAQVTTYRGSSIGGVSFDTHNPPAYCAYDSNGVVDGTVVTFGYRVGITGSGNDAFTDVVRTKYNLGTDATVSLWFSGTITVQVKALPAPAQPLCVSSPADAVCINVDVQATTEKKTTVSIPMDSPNIIKPASWSQKTSTGFIPTKADLKSWRLTGWSAENADVNGKTIDQLNALLVQDKKNPNTLIFTVPTNWSGQLIYGYDLNKVGANGLLVTQDPAKWVYSSKLIITVHPTLTAPDAIASDPNTAVTVPLLGKGTLPIIGSAKFKDASCVFASNEKTKDSALGSIKNAGGQKNPVFTPKTDFQGAVDLLCTVNDKYGITSNAVTVTINVGKVAPTAPACDKNCGSSIISVTGGSVASPMTTGMAAVVLLMAAGAGVLVVRRRTSLAG